MIGLSWAESDEKKLTFDKAWISNTAKQNCETHLPCTIIENYNTEDTLSGLICKMFVNYKETTFKIQFNIVISVSELKIFFFFLNQVNRSLVNSAHCLIQVPPLQLCGAW